MAAVSRQWENPWVEGSSLRISGCLGLEECDQEGSHSPEGHQPCAVVTGRRVQKESSGCKNSLKAFSFSAYCRRGFIVQVILCRQNCNYLISLASKQVRNVFSNY